MAASQDSLIYAWDGDAAEDAVDAVGMELCSAITASGVDDPRALDVSSFLTSFVSTRVVPLVDAYTIYENIREYVYMY